MAHFCIECVLELRLNSLKAYGPVDNRKCNLPGCGERVRNLELSIVKNQGFTVDVSREVFKDLRGQDVANRTTTLSRFPGEVFNAVVRPLGRKVAETNTRAKKTMTVIITNQNYVDRFFQFERFFPNGLGASKVLPTREITTVGIPVTMKHTKGFYGEEYLKITYQVLVFNLQGVLNLPTDYPTSPAQWHRQPGFIPEAEIKEAISKIPRKLWAKQIDFAPALLAHATALAAEAAQLREDNPWLGFSVEDQELLAGIWATGELRRSERLARQQEEAEAVAGKCSLPARK